MRLLFWKTAAALPIAIVPASGSAVHAASNSYKTHGSGQTVLTLVQNIHVATCPAR